MADEYSQLVTTPIKDGDTIVSTDGGFPALAKRGSVYDLLEIDNTSGGLKVDLVDATGITVDVDVEQYADGTADTGAEKGNIALGSDGSNFYYLSTDASGQLQTAHDANSNPVFAKITDGSQEWSIDASGYGQVDIAAQSLTAVAVSGDSSANAVANPIHMAVGDGTTEADVLSGTLDALYVAHTDGTNTSPTMDVNTRAGFVQITDGTEELLVNADGSINVITTVDRTDTTWDYGSVVLVKDTQGTVNSYSPSSGTDEIIGLVLSGRGYCEWEIEFGVTSSEATIAGFWTTPSSPTFTYHFPEAIEIASTETILVKATNREKSASTGSDFTGYATIIYKD